MNSVTELIETVTSLHAQKSCHIIASMLCTSLEAQVALIEKTSALEAEVEKFRSHNAWLKNQIFGKKAESLIKPADQENLANPSAPSPAEVEIDQKKLDEAKSLAKQARKLMREAGVLPKPPKPPQQVLVETIRRRVPKGMTCNACDGEILDQGLAHQASELDIIPLAFVERQFLLHRGECDCGAVNFIMPGPERALDQTLASPRLVSKVIIDKFRYHIPIHRQEKMFADHGVFINRSVLNGWVLRAWTQLSPLVERICVKNREENRKQCDETPVCVVKDEKSKKYFLWCLLTDKAATFKLTEKRNRLEAKAFLGENGAAVTTDGHSIYSKTTINGIHGGCWAHARRNFFLSLLTFPKEAWAVLMIIQDLFLVEREAKVSKLDTAGVLMLRMSKSVILLNELMVLLNSLNPPPKSKMGKAITYIKKRWPELTAFLKDGGIPLHNNAVESLFRGVKLGFKNFLFCKSEVGCEAVAGFYTIITTCGMHGVDAASYLADVLIKLANGWPQKQLDELLPWNWQPRKIPIAEDDENGRVGTPTALEEVIDIDEIISKRKLSSKVRKKSLDPPGAVPDSQPTASMLHQ